MGAAQLARSVQPVIVCLVASPFSCIVLQVLLASILGRLEAMLDVLAAQGFEPLQPAYLAAWLHSGQQVKHLTWQACMRVAWSSLLGWVMTQAFLCKVARGGVVGWSRARWMLAEFRSNRAGVEGMAAATVLL